MMSKQTTLTVEENGELVLPVELLAQYGLKPGDSISVEELELGRLAIDMRVALGERLLKQIRDSLSEEGTTYEDSMRDADVTRTENARVKYGLDDDDDDAD
jgi:bifunctional DNA-binding transcriptional regulator/antitoxin component of YhaV-PrlF toxin-antitoxin module